MTHRSCYKDWSLLSRQMKWSRRSSRNYAATHQLCLIPLSCSEKHTGQPLPMSYGFFLDLMFKPMSQLKTVDMSWTGGTYTTNPMISQIYIQMHRQPVYTAYVTHKYRDAVVVFDCYDSTGTKDKAHQRQLNGNCGTTVTFTGDTSVIVKKDQFLANQQNKQRFIF